MNYLLFTIYHLQFTIYLRFGNLIMLFKSIVGEMTKWRINGTPSFARLSTYGAQEMVNGK